MIYKLVVSKHAAELLDNLLHHLLYHLKSEQTASHLLEGIAHIYNRLEENPFQFPISKDPYLNKKNYREAIVPKRNYILIFCVKAQTVNILGIFHQLENYQDKL